MFDEAPVPDDVQAWQVVFDAWLGALRASEPHDDLTDLKNALLDDLLDARGVTPAHRPWPSALPGPGSARADPMEGEPGRSDRP